MGFNTVLRYRAACENKKKYIFLSSSRSEVRRAISTKFCTVIEVVRAIILGLILFWVPSIVLPLGGVENLAENAPIEVIVNNFVIYRNKAAIFGKIM